MGQSPSPSFTLSTGKEVQLRHLTMADREQCEDAICHRYDGDGNLILEGLARTRNLWCRKGLGSDLEALLEYTSAELNELALEVRRRAGQFQDPTGQES